MKRERVCEDRKRLREMKLIIQADYQPLSPRVLDVPRAKIHHIDARVSVCSPEVSGGRVRDEGHRRCRDRAVW